MLSKLKQNFIGLVLTYRLTVLVVVVALSVLASSGVTRLGFASDYRVFFGTDNPELAAWDDFQATFSRNDNVLYVLQFPEGGKFDGKMAGIVEELTERAWALPSVTRVDSLSNFQRTHADGDTLMVSDLITDAASLNERQIAERLAYAIDEPVLFRALISEDARTVGVNTTVELQGDPSVESRRAAVAAQELAAEFRAKYPGLKIAMNGSIIMNYGFVESGERDMTSIVPAMYAVMLVLTWIFLRSVTAVLATFVTIVLSTTIAVGLGGFTGQQMAPITIIAPNIILTLAIADCIHIISTAQRGLREGMTKIDALRMSLDKNFSAVLVTSATTVVGFLCLNFSDAPPFQYLGNMTAFGVAAAWILSITLVPILLSYLPLSKGTQRDGQTWLSARLAGLAAMVIARYVTVLIVGCVVSMLLVGAALTNRLDDQFTRYFSDRLQVRQDLNFASDNLRGQDIYEYEIRSGEPGGISDPDYLANLSKLTDWLRQQPNVGQVASITDVIKRLNQNMNGGDPAFYRIPDDRALAAQYLLLYELSLPFGLDLNNQINLDKSSTRLSVTMFDTRISEQEAYHQALRDWAADNMPDGMVPEPNGTSYIFASLTLRNLQDMITGNIVAVIVIAMMMALTFRSLSLGVISIITNAIPALVAFGLWAIAVGYVGMAVAVIGAASLGIVVDDSVHFLTKYVRGLREKGLSKAEAIRYAFAEVGEAIVYTTLIVGIGFAMIATSTFQVNAQLGLLVAITVVAALVFDFLVLPAILLIGSRTTTHKTPTQEEGTSDAEFA